MIKAADLKKGDVVDVDGAPHIVETFFAQKPGARGAGTLYKVRLRGLVTKRKIDRVFRGDDVLQEEDFERRPVQVLYGDAAGLTFMDLEDFSQFTWTKDDLENEWPYLTEGMEGLQALVSGGRVIALELPARVVMKIIETRPSVKGGSVTARTKPAVMSTSLIVQVPEYMVEGEMIRIDTRSGEFVSKV